MRTLVIGDIHGGAKALKQCLKRSGFDNNKDRLIYLGDVCDGWSETKEVINILLTIKNLVAIRGNHDQWLLEWFLHGATPLIWVSQGGQATLDSYGNIKNVPDNHIKYIDNSLFYFKSKNRLFVHGGFITSCPIRIQNPYER